MKINMSRCELYIFPHAPILTLQCHLRAPNNAETVSIFEIDLPEVQKKKRDELQNAVLSPEDSEKLNLVSFVGVDFSERSLVKQLKQQSQFDTSRPTVVLMEGLTQYLPASATEATLKELSDCLPAVKVIVGYIDERTFADPSHLVGKAWGDDGVKLQMFLAMTAKVGEKWISGWSSDSFKAMRKSANFSVISETLPSDANEKYLKPLGRLSPPEHKFDVERWAVLEKMSPPP